MHRVLETKLSSQHTLPVILCKQDSAENGPDDFLTYMGTISPPNVDRKPMTNERMTSHPGSRRARSWCQSLLAGCSCSQVACQPARNHCGGYLSLQ